MRRFDPDATCRKCGSDNLWRAYHAKYVCGHSGCKERHSPHGCDDPSEHIHRGCRECQFEWMEACCDKGEG